ncbi:MAG: universal stress protein [Nitrospirae bacterium]|nr:MAG: universal stress protein [Nitrospirota bacterium]
MAPLITNILLATDFSDCAALAQDYALLLASTWKADLAILHVLEFQPGMDPELPVNHVYLEQLRKDAEQQLTDLRAQLARRGLAGESRHVTGIPSLRIAQEATEAGADLVVLGTHGRTGLAHVLLGSTAERVIASAPCPVLTVRRQREPARPQAALPSIRRLLVPVDFSDHSLEALEYAARVAKQFGAALTLLHVIEPVAYGLDFTLSIGGDARETRAGLEARLADLAAPLLAQGLAVKPLVRGGTPADSILDWTRHQACDLIVMGTHGRRGLAHLAGGSVAEAVLRRAPCPVLTVKSPKFSPGHQRH